MAAAVPTTSTTPATKIAIAGKIALAAKLIASASILAGFRYHREQAAHMRAMTLLAHQTSISILIARQYLKARVAITTIILIEWHNFLPTLSSEDSIYTTEFGFQVR